MAQMAVSGGEQSERSKSKCGSGASEPSVSGVEKCQRVIFHYQTQNMVGIKHLNCVFFCFCTFPECMAKTVHPISVVNES